MRLLSAWSMQYYIYMYKTNNAIMHLLLPVLIYKRFKFGNENYFQFMKCKFRIFIKGYIFSSKKYCKMYWVVFIHGAMPGDITTINFLCVVHKTR